MSIEHIKYLKKEKRNKLIIKIIQISILVIFLLIWEYLGRKDIINTFITSTPSRIIETLKELYIENNLFKHINTTILETIISFIITCILSLIISIILYEFNTLYKILSPYLLVINSLPKIALGPLIIIWMGANTKSIITMSVLISLIVSIENIYNGFISTDKLKIKLLKSFNANKKDILFTLILPSNKSNIINAFKINISMCLIGVISGEFLTSKMGIGYLITYGTQVFNLDLVMSGILILLIISFLMYILIKKAFQ